MFPRWWISLTSCVVLTAATVHSILPAQAADAVMCVNCGSEYTQLANKLTMVKQLATQAQQLKAQLSQLADMTTNSKTVGTQIWGNTVGDFKQLQNLLSKSRSLANLMGNLDGQFASRYGTYTSYLNKKMNSATWQGKYAQWSDQAYDNTLYTLKGLGLQANQMQNDQLVMKRLQQMSGTAEGRMEALQVANMLASQTADQIYKLRELGILQASMQAEYLAQQQDKDAASRAAANKMYNFTPLPYRGGQSYDVK